MRSYGRGMSILWLVAIIIAAAPPLMEGADLQLRIVVENAGIRTQPDIASDILEMDVPVGTLLTAVKRAGDWYEIRHRSRMGMETTGYIHSMYVEEVTAAAPLPEAPPVKKPEVQADYDSLPSEGRVRTSRALRGGIQLSGGLALVGPADFNDMVDGYEDIYSGSARAFEWNRLASVQEFSGEIILPVSWNIGLGFGAGYMFKNAAAQYGTSQYNYDREYKLSVIPLTGTIHIGLSLNPAMDLNLLGGAGFYMGKLKHDYYYTSSSGSTDNSEDVSSNTFGFHAGAGLVIHLSPGLSLVVNGLYRLVNFSEWKGTKTYTSGNSYDGTLYYVEYLGYPRLWVFDSSPSSSSYSNIRPAEINLNGPVFRIGIRIGF